MNRLVQSVILIAGLSACATTPGATTAGQSQGGATPTTELSQGPSAEASGGPSAGPSAGPADLLLTQADAPTGFTLSSEEEITIASEVALYGPQDGPAREAALTERGFIGGARRVFDGDGAHITNEAWVFDKAAGARAEFDEVAALYVGACPGQIDTGGTIGDVSASWVCGPLDTPAHPHADVMFVQGGVMILVRWVDAGAGDPITQALLVDLARRLQARLP